MFAVRLLSALIVVVLAFSGAEAQCETWNDSPRKEDAENAHVVYRQYVKSKDFAGAFEQWKIAYEIAPAADGRRDVHYEDGVAIYRDFLLKETDEAKKTEYKEKMIELYDAGAQCIADKKIIYKGCTTDECVQQKLGQWLGQKAVDMYYYINAPREQSMEVFRESLQLAGNTSNYTVLKPSTDIVVYLFLQGKIDAATARDYLKKINDIADYNIENNAKYAQYYEYEKTLMQPEIAKIEKEIYDCAYFVNKLTPMY